MNENELKLLLKINSQPAIVTKLLTEKYGYTLAQLQLMRNKRLQTKL